MFKNDTEINLLSAVGKCIEQGMEIASIFSQQENDELKELFKSVECNSLYKWMGLVKHGNDIVSWRWLGYTDKALE